MEIAIGFLLAYLVMDTIEYAYTLGFNAGVRAVLRYKRV